MRGAVIHAPATSVSRTAPTRSSSSRPTRSSAISATCVMRVRPVGLPRHQPRDPAHPDGSRQYSAVIVEETGSYDVPRSGLASSSSARSSLPTTPARSAGPVTRPAASTANTLGAQRRPGTVPARPARRWHPASPPPTCRTPSWYRRWADRLGRAGHRLVLALSLPTCSPVRPSLWSVTARVGLLAVLAAQQLGAGQIIAFSRHEPRQKTSPPVRPPTLVTERGDLHGAARIKDLTNGLGAHCVRIEAVSAEQSTMTRPSASTRPGGHVGYVGVSHDACHCPARSTRSTATPICTAAPPPYAVLLPDLINRVWTRAASTRQGLSTSPCPSIRSPRATRPWTSAAPSRRCAWNPDLWIPLPCRGRLSPTSRPSTGPHIGLGRLLERRFQSIKPQGRRLHSVAGTR